MKRAITLSESEEQVFIIVASAEKDLPILEIVEKANEKFGKERKFQTIATFLHRTEEKNYLSSYKIGRYTYYHAKVSMEQYKKQQIEQMRDILFDGSIENLISFAKKC